MVCLRFFRRLDNRGSFFLNPRFPYRNRLFHPDRPLLSLRQRFNGVNRFWFSLGLWGLLHRLGLRNRGLGYRKPNHGLLASGLGYRKPNHGLLAS